LATGGALYLYTSEKRGVPLQQKLTDHYHYLIHLSMYTTLPKVLTTRYLN
jgi:hypothetical protein